MWLFNVGLPTNSFVHCLQSPCGGGGRETIGSALGAGLRSLIPVNTLTDLGTFVTQNTMSADLH